MVHNETSMQFDNLEAALEIEVDKDEAERKGWLVALVSKKVDYLIILADLKRIVIINYLNYCKINSYS